MYRLIVESLMGLHLEADSLRITPCIPAGWNQCKIHYRYRETFYHITIDSQTAPPSFYGITLDGKTVAEDCIMLVDDRRDHHVVVTCPHA